MGYDPQKATALFLDAVQVFFERYVQAEDSMRRVAVGPPWISLKKYDVHSKRTGSITRNGIMPQPAPATNRQTPEVKRKRSVVRP